MPSQSRLPPTQNAGTDTSTSSGTPGPAAGQSNSAIAGFIAEHGEELGTGRYLRDAMTGEETNIHLSIDMGILEALEAQMSEVPQAWGTAVSLAGEAASFQQENDLGAWEGKLIEIEDEPGPILDSVHLQATIQIDNIERYFKGAAADPRFESVKSTARSVEVTAKAAKYSVAQVLSPNSVRGQFVSGLQPDRIDPSTPFSEVIPATRERLGGVIQAAFDAETMAFDAKETSGYGLESRVLSLAVGPLGAFPVGSPQFDYVWKSFTSQGPSDAVHDGLVDLFGLRESYKLPAVKAAEIEASWSTGRPIATLPVAPSANDYAPGANEGRDPQHDAMSGRATAPQTQGLDTSTVSHPKSEPWEEEEEEEKEEKPPEKPPTGEPTKYGATATATTEAGKVKGSVTGTASTNPEGSGHDGEVTLEGGADSEGAYGTVGGKYTNRHKDDNGKSGMDVSVGGKVGTNEQGQVVGEGNYGTKVAHEDGSSTEYGGSVGWNGEGVEVGQSAKRTRDLENGNKQETYGSAKVDSNGNVTVGGGRAEKDAEGNVKKSTDVTGSVDMNPTDGTQGANVAASHQKGAVKVAVNAGWKQSMEKPVKLDDGRWSVKYTEVFTGGGSLGGQGKKVGASAGIQVGHTNSGTRIFKTESEAKDFYEHGDVSGAPESADEARRMQEGETRNEGTSVQGNLSGNAKVGMFSVGGGVTAGNEHYTKTTRGKKGMLRMEVGADVFSGWNASAGAGGVSLGYGESHTDSSSRTVEFDLDTDVGRWAYDYYQEHEKLPASGRGWRLVGDMKGQSDTRVKNLDLLGIAVGVSHTVSHTDRTEDGHKIEEDLGTEGTSVSIPILGSYSESHSLWMQQVDEGHALYHTNSQVKSDDGDDVRRGLARSTGYGAGSSGSNKGTYKVQSVYSEAEIDAFCRRILAGPPWGGTLHSDLPWLKSKLQSTPDKDGRRRLLARWVADAGDDALQALFDETSKSHEFYVEIEGDPYFKGMSGQLEQEARIASFQKRLDDGEGGFGIVNDVRKDLDYQRRRRDALRKYGELPAQQLSMEYTRTDQHLANLQLLLDRALATITEMAPDTQVAGETGQFQQAMQLLRRSREQYATAHRRVHRHRRIHLDGWGRNMGLSDSGYEEMTSERGKYKEADRLYTTGQGKEAAAQLWEAKVNAMEFGPEKAGLMGSFVARAAFEFQAAARTFDKSSEIYSEIASRRTDYAGLLAGYQYDYVDGQ